MLMPYRLQISLTTLPIANWIIIGLTVISYYFQSSGIYTDSILNAMLLNDWSITSLLGNMFLHGDIFHLAGNMLILYLFGNAINSHVGNLAYPFIYFFLGLCAATIHNLLSGVPALGASGAINGIVGMALIWIPLNNLKVFYSIFFIFNGVFNAKVYAIIIIYVLFDLLALFVNSTDGVAHWAHLGGWVPGVILGLIILKMKWIETYDETIFEINDNRRKIDRKYYLDDIKDERGIDVETHLDAQNLEANELVLLAKIEQKELDLVDAAPKFRVLRALPGIGHITCFFVNEGDEISNIKINETKDFVVEIFPNEKLKHKGSGTIKFTDIDSEMQNEFRFRIQYNNGTTHPNEKEIVYYLDKNIFEVNEIYKTV